MAISTTSTISNALPTFKAAARLTLKQTGVTRKYVDNVKLPESSGLTYNEPLLSGFSVIGLSEGVDMSIAQTISDSNVAVTVAEAGGQVIITDVAEMALRDPIVIRLGEGLANAYANKVDNDLTSLFSGLDAGFGSSTATTAAGWLRAAHSRLLAASRPVSGPLGIVLHPYQWDDISADVASLNTGFFRSMTGTPAVNDQPGASITGLTEDVWRNYKVGQLFGVPIDIDPTISIASSAGYGAIFSRDSLIYIEYRAPEMEDQRDASLRATELNYVGLYGKGERVGTWGFYFNTDLTAPTS